MIQNSCKKNGKMKGLLLGITSSYLDSARNVKPFLMKSLVYFSSLNHILAMQILCLKFNKI